MTPSQCGLLMHGQQDQSKLGFLGVLGQKISIQNAPPQLGVVVFSKELVEFRWVSWFTWALAQGLVLHPHNHKALDSVCPLGLTPIVSSHAGNLLAISHQVQDM